MTGKLYIGYFKTCIKTNKTNFTKNITDFTLNHINQNFTK